MWTFIDAEIRWKTREDIKDELFITYWNAQTKIQADFAIRWHFLNIPVPKLEIFEDSWLALYQCGQDFLKMLAENDNKNLTKNEMKVKLLEIGFVDKTHEDV